LFETGGFDGLGIGTESVARRVDSVDTVFDILY
jgi:hypothetical protein